MKRRSFLAMLGLAPTITAAAPSEVAAISGDIVGAATIADRPPLDPNRFFGSWICPEHQAHRDAAREAGEDEPEVSIRMASVARTDDHCGLELQALDSSGRVVMRQWNKR